MSSVGEWKWWFQIWAFGVKVADLASKLTVAPGFKENEDDLWSTCHSNKGFADGKLLHRLTTPSRIWFSSESVDVQQ